MQSNCIIFSTAKAEWDAIAAIYFDGADISQAYDLKKNIMRLKTSLEDKHTTTIFNVYGEKLIFAAEIQ
jgi:hypothetical protein